MQAYVINLLDRSDRWAQAISQQTLLGYKINRLDAVSINSNSLVGEIFTASGVAATWKSHQKAMSQFLETQEAFSLVLEDDFDVIGKISIDLEQLMLKLDLDFLQLGYLTPHILDRLYITLANIQDLLLKACAKLLWILPMMSKKLLIREQLDIPLAIVLNDIRAGGQAYIVSRKFAEAAQSMNTPTFLSTDGLFMALGVSRNFRMARLRRMWISQTNSPSSVTNRFRE
jgi:hypothetical protein